MSRTPSAPPSRPALRPPRRIGLIAGAGEFPLLVLRGARAAGVQVVVIGLAGCYDAAVRQAAEVFYECGIARLGRWIRLLRREGVQQAVMAGQVRKAQMLALPRWRQWLAYLPDWTSIKIWYWTAADRRNDTLLRAVAEEMSRKGVELIDSTTYTQEAMAPAGTLTRCGLTAAQEADAALGWRVAQEMGRLDVGQSVAVKDKDILAVEAIEGTDAMIRRAGGLCLKGGWVLVKVAKPNQDMRFDVPTVGPDTIRRLAEAGAGALVVEAGRTLMINRPELIALAEKHRIAVAAWSRPPG